VTPLTRDQK